MKLVKFIKVVLIISAVVLAIDIVLSVFNLININWNRLIKEALWIVVLFLMKTYLSKEANEVRLG
jgi:hypothetical protein